MKKFKLRIPKKSMKELFIALVNNYGKDNELYTFEICSNYGVELANSTIDKIVIVGTDVLFYYNENTGDYDLLEAFKDKDLLDFYNGIITTFEVN